MLNRGVIKIKKIAKKLLASTLLIAASNSFSADSNGTTPDLEQNAKNNQYSTLFHVTCGHNKSIEQLKEHAQTYYETAKDQNIIDKINAIKLETEHIEDEVHEKIMGILSEGDLFNKNKVVESIKSFGNGTYGDARLMKKYSEEKFKEDILPLINNVQSSLEKEGYLEEEEVTEIIDKIVHRLKFDSNYHKAFDGSINIIKSDAKARITDPASDIDWAECKNSRQSINLKP